MDSQPGLPLVTQTGPPEPCSPPSIVFFSKAANCVTKLSILSVEIFNFSFLIFSFSYVYFVSAIMILIFL